MRVASLRIQVEFTAAAAGCASQSFDTLSGGEREVLVDVWSEDFVSTVRIFVQILTAVHRVLRQYHVPAYRNSDSDCHLPSEQISCIGLEVAVEGQTGGGVVGSLVDSAYAPQ